MNISSGISAINIASGSGVNRVSNKTYVWPVYQDGKVEKIKSANRQFGEPVYFKPSENARDEILKNAALTENSYTPQGTIAKTSPKIERGSLFSAFA